MKFAHCLQCHRLSHDPQPFSPCFVSFLFESVAEKPPHNYSNQSQYSINIHICMIFIYIYIYIYIKDHTSLSRTEFSGFKWIICAWADRRMSNLMLSFRESQVSYLIEAKRIYVVTYHQLMMFQCALFIINNILLSWNHCNDTISLYIYFCDSSADRCLMLKMTSQQPDYNPNVIFFVVYGKTGYNNDKKMIRNIESLIV